MSTIVIGVEEWRPVPDFEDRYEVSSHGRIKRTAPGKGTHPNKIRKLRVHTTPSGVPYAYIDLHSKEGAKRVFSVHRLVALAFHGTPPPEHEVRHLDGNPLNNHAHNLTWGTKSENANDRKRHGTDRNLAKTECRNGHLYSPENTYVVPSTGERHCRTCARDNARRYRRRK